MQVLIGLNSRGMISVFPERSSAPFALIIFLCRAPGYQLHTLGNDILASVFHQEVNIVGCHHVIKPKERTASLPRKLSADSGAYRAFREFPRDGSSNLWNQWND
jgi:hypothetical protein